MLGATQFESSWVGPGRLELLTNGLKVTGSWVLPRASGPSLLLGRWV